MHVWHLDLFSATGNYLRDSSDDEIKILNVCHEDVEICIFVVNTENSFLFS